MNKKLKDRPVIAILDFTTAEIHIHPYDKKSNEDANEIVDRLGYNSNDCDYMCMNNLILTIHE